jgi:Zn-dependent protease
MMPGTQGAIRLFRFAGIDVYLHWLWFLGAYYIVQSRRSDFSSLTWNVAACLAGFAIVLLHEFGHSLACRQVGGSASRIVLWPFGGVAFVNPPQRPGATLWSIAAGPLVNVVLVVPLLGLYVLSRVFVWGDAYPNAVTLLIWVTVFNGIVLVFNLLPVYPLDGGQILRSLLWFVIGRARSLTVATVVGFFGVAALGVRLMTAERGPNFWNLAVLGFLGVNCWSGFRQARELSHLEKLPRHHGFACPVCRTAPPIAPLWMCGQCHVPYDVFEAHAVCPHCGARVGALRCIDCGELRPIDAWRDPAGAPFPL